MGVSVSRCCNHGRKPGPLTPQADRENTSNSEHRDTVNRQAKKKRGFVKQRLEAAEKLRNESRSEAGDAGKASTKKKPKKYGTTSFEQNKFKQQRSKVQQKSYKTWTPPKAKKEAAPKKREFKHKVKTLDELDTRKAPSHAPVHVKAQRSSVFGQEEVESTVGMSAKDRAKIWAKNASSVDKVDMNKRKARQENDFKAAPKLSKEKREAARKAALVRTMTMKKQDDEIQELFSLTSVAAEEDKGETAPAAGGEIGVKKQVANGSGKTTKKGGGLDPTKGVNLNNTAALSKLSDQKREEAYHNLVALCKKTKGEFQMTNSQLDDQFAILLAKEALVPGASPGLTKINLESNKIGNQGLFAIAKAIAKLPTLTSIKLRHQLLSPSVAAQEALVNAMEENTSLVTLGIDLKKDLRVKADKLESRNRDLLRKKRKAARDAAKK